jgi:hypothetical protein
MAIYRKKSPGTVEKQKNVVSLGKARNDAAGGGSRIITIKIT